MHFERVGVEAGGLAQLFDRQIDLVGDQEVEPENVVRRLAGAAAIDPFAVAQLVALPRLADGQAGEQRDQRGEQRRVARSCRPSSARIRPAIGVPAALRAQNQLRSDRARRRRRLLALLTQSTRERTSSTASAGAAARPTRDEHRQVEHVVAHVGDLLVLQEQRVDDLLVRFELAGDALMHERDAELRRALRRWPPTCAPTAARPSSPARCAQTIAVPSLMSNCLLSVPSACSRILPSVSTPSTSNSSSLIADAFAFIGTEP